MVFLPGGNSGDVSEERGVPGDVPASWQWRSENLNG